MVRLLAALVIFLGGLPAAAQVRVLPRTPVWPSGVPLAKGWPGDLGGPVQEDLRGEGERLYNVTTPTLQAYLPDPATATGAAVIVAPGGGFRFLAVRHEGEQVARWLAEHGVAAFVLNYRLIQTPPGETENQFRSRVQARGLSGGMGGVPGAEDGLQALRLVRAGAAAWGIDPARIGVVGFSAGGHVAGMTLFAPEGDRPAFAGLIYGMPFADPMPPIPPANLPYPSGTPTEPWLQPPATPAPGRGCPRCSSPWRRTISPSDWGCAASTTSCSRPATVQSSTSTPRAATGSA